ncbi:MAG TPA: pyridoxamine 5'-phosphate oxidase family protein [Lacipirellulaceae bacterium]|nr:pyridoxamine 5'-phosphate oxidase family protein [Lacipirellulaceae bacterium]
MPTDVQAHLKDLLHDFDTAMMVTHGPDGALHGRPMAVAQVEDNGDLWFVTDRHSGKMHEIGADAHVCVTMQGAGKFISLAGTASPHDDRRKVAEVWNEHMKVWFPGGKDDPNLVLLKVDAREGEYWDNSGANAIKYMVKAGRAYLRGERPSNDDTEHAKVKL